MTLLWAPAVHERQSPAPFTWPTKLINPISPLLHFLLRVTALRLELDEFFGNLVIGSLRQDTKYRPTGFIQVDALGEWQPTGTATLLYNVSQLQNCHADQTIFTRKAVIFSANVQLITVWLRLISKNTKTKTTNSKFIPWSKAFMVNSQQC